MHVQLLAQGEFVLHEGVGVDLLDILLLRRLAKSLIRLPWTNLRQSGSMGLDVVGVDSAPQSLFLSTFKITHFGVLQNTGNLRRVNAQAFTNVLKRNVPRFNRWHVLDVWVDPLDLLGVEHVNVDDALLRDHAAREHRQSR